jgi:hypothetical protein
VKLETNIKQAVSRGNIFATCSSEMSVELNKLHDVISQKMEFFIGKTCVDMRMKSGRESTCKR